MMLLMIIINLILLFVVGLVVTYFRLELKDATAQAQRTMLELVGRDEIIENYEQDFLSKDERIDGLTNSVVDLETKIDHQKEEIALMAKANGQWQIEAAARDETIEGLHRLLDRAQQQIESLETTVSARDETVLFHTNNCLPDLERMRAGVE